MNGEYYTLLIVRSCACDCVCYLTIYHKSSQSEPCVMLLEQNSVYLLVNALKTVQLATAKYNIIFCVYAIEKPLSRNRPKYKRNYQNHCAIC